MLLREMRITKGIKLVDKNKHPTSLKLGIISGRGRRGIQNGASAYKLLLQSNVGGHLLSLMLWIALSRSHCVDCLCGVLSFHLQPSFGALVCHWLFLLDLSSLNSESVNFALGAMQGLLHSCGGWLLVYHLIDRLLDVAEHQHAYESIPLFVPSKPCPWKSQFMARMNPQAAENLRR
ncbi:hypothetical protein FEM48_Zijuj11G0157900 [Ziziphus jujuba var. spinosa]|uniref:Uncharacterized protein n=1 Tax=Ziziphus jujuba var. spinosa TaxID=714518 RepID=A0A978UJU7_ZIZJJ|nr:hypothetical protein FEM48_Zijuj11G0157900 [Ziziphus jujuba var. spinosa]